MKYIFSVQQYVILYSFSVLTLLYHLLRGCEVWHVLAANVLYVEYIQQLTTRTNFDFVSTKLPMQISFSIEKSKNRDKLDVSYSLTAGIYI